MTDFPILRKSDLDPMQAALWDELTLGPRGVYTGGRDTTRLPDLYNTWLQFPELGHAMLLLGDGLRAQTALDGRLRELVVLTTSKKLNVQVEFDFHVAFAREQGLSEALIAAIDAGEAPPFADEKERAIYQANLQLIETASLTDALRAEVIAFIGYQGLVQLIGAVGLYMVTAYTSNVAKVELARDFSADPAELTAFFSGKSGARGRADPKA